jgi:hypothetical protein
MNAAGNALISLFLVSNPRETRDEKGEMILSAVFLNICENSVNDPRWILLKRDL